MELVLFRTGYLKWKVPTTVLKLAFSLLAQLIPAKPKVCIHAGGPYRFRVPSHLAPIGENRTWREVYLEVVNKSKRTLGSVRVQLGIKLNAPPEIDSSESPRTKCEYLESANELEITGFDPGCTVRVVAYVAENEGSHFLPTVIVDGDLQLDSPFGFWGWVEFLKSGPGLIAGLFLVLAVLGIGYLSSIAAWPCLVDGSNRCYLRKATDRLAGACTFQVEKVTTATEAKIMRGPFPKDLTMFVNRATSLDELLSREKIVICASQD